VSEESTDKIIRAIHSAALGIVHAILDGENREDIFYWLKDIPKQQYSYEWPTDTTTERE